MLEELLPSGDERSKPAVEAKCSRKAWLRLRTWSRPVPVSVAHSYIGGTGDFGGLSGRLETLLPFDPLTTTLRELRQGIEEKKVKNMNRRTLLYQHFQSTMRDLENHYNYPENVAMSYRFGLWDQDNAPRIIPAQSESDLVSKWIPKPLEQDLILIAQSQISPNDDCVP